MNLIALTVNTAVQNEINKSGNAGVRKLRSLIGKVTKQWIKDHSVKYLINSNDMNIVLNSSVPDLEMSQSLAKSSGFNQPVIASGMTSSLGLNAYKILGKG